MVRSLGRLALTTLMIGMLAEASAAQTVELVSGIPPRIAPATGGGDSSTSRRGPSFSADNRFFVFSSKAANLVPGQADFNHEYDVFLYDRVAGTTILVSHALGSATAAGDADSAGPVISADGHYVAFISNAMDLVAGQVNPRDSGLHAFLYERLTGKITLVSRQASRPNQATDGSSGSLAISADGGYVAFTSTGIDLVPGQVQGGNPDRHVYLFERSSGTNRLVSRAAVAANQTGNGNAEQLALSADGRFVAYASRATDLVSGQIDSNDSEDVFLYDRLTGTNALVSHTSSSAVRTGDRVSTFPSITADGQTVAFASGADDLVASASVGNLFLYDRLLGTVSPTAPGYTGSVPRISADGSALIFFSSDPELLGQPASLYHFDRLAGTTELLAQESFDAALSANGRSVAFTSRESFVAPGQITDNNNARDVYLYDATSGRTTPVSHASSSPAVTGNADSLTPAISPDGSWVAFVSYSDNLAAGKRDNNLSLDVYLYERATAANRIVSLHPAGLASSTPIARSSQPSISADGRYVVFTSDAYNLIPGQVERNGRLDVFLHDRVTRKTILVSRASGSPLVTGNAEASRPQISRDGNYIVFESRATDLVAGQNDAGSLMDVFLYHRPTGAMTLVSRSSTSPTSAANGESSVAGLSTDGGRIVFSSSSTDLVPGQDDLNEGGLDLFVFERRRGTVALVSRSAASAVQTGNASSFFNSMTPDGESLSFSSFASNLIAGAQDTNGDSDLFVHQRSSGKTTLISQTGTGSPRMAATGFFSILSADGRYVAFSSAGSGLVPGQGNPSQETHAFLLDRKAGKVLRVSPAAAQLQSLSDDGRYLLYSSLARNVLVGQNDTNDANDLFLFDRDSGKALLVSHLPGAPARTGNQASGPGALSTDGRYVAFFSAATNLLAPAPASFSSTFHLFLYDRRSGAVTLADHSTSAPSIPGNAEPREPALSALGGFLAFTSPASDLVPLDFNGRSDDVFVYAIPRRKEDPQ